MCTPCTLLTRLVRWRVKDWALNFLTCGFPLEEEEEPKTFFSPSRQVSTVNMVFDTKNNASRGQKSRRTIRSSTKAPDTNYKTASSTKKRSSDDQTNWPHFEDEDYIVFCFKENGAFEVVKDVKSEASSNHVNCTMPKSPRPVNRKLNYGDENAETLSKQRHDKVVLNEDVDEIYSRNQRDSITSDKEVNEEDIIYLDTMSPPSNKLHRGDQIEEHDEERGTVSVESNGSNQSDNSTGSFAFPILGWEWTGSPVQMPKSEGLHLRKHKTRFVPFHCFRFFEKN